MRALLVVAALCATSIRAVAQDRHAAPLLAVFAHPDDERVIAPLVSRFTREGRVVDLVVATDGAKGVTDFAKIPAGPPLAAARAQEAQCAATRLGVRRLRLLGLPDGGLASFGVLGKLRYRLEPLIESAGVSLAWDVDELPPVEALEPSAVFAIQRILLEAISNAMQHAGARLIRVAAHASGDAAISITVADDGKGFNPAAGSAGLGLTSMRRRAAALGASLEIAAAAGGGTVVALTVPRNLAKQASTAYPAAEAASRA